MKVERIEAFMLRVAKGVDPVMAFKSACPPDWQVWKVVQVGSDPHENVNVFRLEVLTNEVAGSDEWRNV